MYVRQRRPGPTPWKPRIKDFILYHELKKRGKTNDEIAEALHIGMNIYWRNRKNFVKYYRKRLKNEGLTEDQVDEKLGESVLDNNPFMKPEILKNFADVGYPIGKLCKMLDCDQGTFWRYMDRHPRLKKIFTLGKEYIDIEVMNSLKKRARGMKIPKVKFGVHQGAFVDEKQYYEILPPDVTAGLAWLINRQGWTRDSVPPQHDHKGKILEALDNMTNDVNDEEMKKFDEQQAEEE